MILKSIATRVVVAFAASASAWAQAGGPAFTVTSLADRGPGSLRQAILDANARPGPDAIGFATGLRGTILLTGGALTITDSLAINGPGAGWLAVRCNHAGRIFAIEGGYGVTIAGLTITPGLAGMGGGILLLNSSLTLSRVVLLDNRAIGGSGGGGIGSAMGTVKVTDSALIANQAVGGNGGNGLGGAILSSGPLTMTNSVIAGNRALGGSGGTGSRGGIFLQPMTLATSSFVQNSLVSGNQALGGSSGNDSVTVGNGLGGGLFVNTAATVNLEGGGVTNSVAIGGQGIGGGIYSLGNLTVSPSTTIAGNRASTTGANVYPPPGSR